MPEEKTARATSRRRKLKKPRTMTQLDFALADCMAAVGRGCNMRISPEAAEWWIKTCYRPRFHNAIDGNGSLWLQDRDGVLIIARLLGQTAAKMAEDHNETEVSLAVAKQASLHTNCSTSPAKRILGAIQRRKLKGVPEALYVWCEEPPPPPHPGKKKP